MEAEGNQCDVDLLLFAAAEQHHRGLVFFYCSSLAEEISSILYDVLLCDYLIYKTYLNIGWDLKKSPLSSKFR